ncbi:maleylpyruvate isomerase family mycothiol-dependent enzyme [Streptomyces sp. NBC_00247]|uniref:maleylpyruvate isomerase family mycothiol-dependent enzyme n=1 Tax=Streptomyces sp. NBC_00247 TaxID=2975689 RepID=UPI002E2CA667|nr:sterol carrier family protein [Streptomyces sp. NBC_00247]
MPPTRKRARRYDPDRTRTAVLAQFAQVGRAVAGLTPDQLARPTRLGDWTVRELAVHLATGLSVVCRNLELPEPRGGKPELTPVEWPFTTAGRAGAIDEDTRALAAAHPDPAALYEEVTARFEAVVVPAPADRLLPTRAGSMLLGDYLVTRTVELIAHTDDLNAATGLDIPYDRQALAAATRLLADALAERAPGGSVEVRVPPFAVVQCIGGPQHTRGTPPNVVETDPLTWIRLATGRAGWSEEREAARVSASGERADLTGLLPLMR